MLQLSETITLEAPLEQAFHAAADPFMQLKWDAATLLHVEKVSPGPLVQGAQYRGKFKGVGTVVYTFADYELNKKYAHDSKIPLGRIYHYFEFQSAGDQQTTMKQGMDVQRSVLGWLLTPVMKGQLRKRIRTINSELKEFLEKK